MNQSYHDFHRGEIFFACLEPSFGHEQGGTRPVLILQNDVGNYYSPTIIVAPATTRRHKRPNMPTHVLLTDIDGLQEDTVFMLEAIRTIDKRRVRSYAGKLTGEQMGPLTPRCASVSGSVRTTICPRRWKRHERTACH